jgi:hypothetical protein
MMRLALTSLLLATSILPLHAQSSHHTDPSGYTTGTQDGRSVNTYTDRYGNTTGWVGGQYRSTYSDGYGGTTGSVVSMLANLVIEANRFEATARPRGRFNGS